MKKHYLLTLILILSGSNLFSQEETKKHSILTDKFQFEVGLFIPSKSIKIGADGSSPNNIIDFDETFKLNDNETTIFFKFDWYFSKKWKLSVETFNIKNANKAVLDQDIVFDEITFEQGSNIRGGFGVNMYRIFFGRAFSRGLKHEFGAGLGVHAMNTSAFIEGDVFTSEGDLEFERKSVSALVPLPNLGIWYYFAPTEKWAFIARLDWFGISIGDYSGSLWDVAPGVKYQIFRNVGIGVDYRYFFLKASVNKSDWSGEFNIAFEGPLFSINASF